MKIPRLLPAEPLVPWLNERIEVETVEGFAERVGWSARRVFEFTSGRTKSITFDRLDTLLAREGTRSIIDFYPEYADDDAFARYAAPVKTRFCDVRKCDGVHHAKGLCLFHYNESKRNSRKIAA